MSAGGPFESSCCVQSARSASRCVSCTRREPTPPPPGALCAEDQVGTLGGGDLVGAGCYGILQAMPTWSSLLPPSFPWSVLSSESCCTSGNCAFATTLSVLDLCFAGWCWIGGGPSLRRWRVIRSLTTKLASSSELARYFSVRSAAGGLLGLKIQLDPFQAWRRIAGGW